MGRTILVVDDNPEERGIFARYLEFVGGEVQLATNGEEAVEAARTTPPDLILLDLTMPVMDGWEAIRELKQDPATERIPVIALTCHHLEWQRLKEAGFSGYLEKPLAPFRVLEEVESCIGKLRWRDARPVSTPRSPDPSPAAGANRWTSLRERQTRFVQQAGSSGRRGW